MVFSARSSSWIGVYLVYDQAASRLSVFDFSSNWNFLLNFEKKIVSEVGAAHISTPLPIKLSLLLPNGHLFLKFCFLSLQFLYLISQPIF